HAEDGIRAGHVTGVQTCALPIFEPVAFEGDEEGTRLQVSCVGRDVSEREPARRRDAERQSHALAGPGRHQDAPSSLTMLRSSNRSEERRVGKRLALEGWRAQ